MRIQVGCEISQEIAKRFGVKAEKFILKSGNVRVSYRNIPCDKDRWVDPATFLPINYDLVDVRTYEDKKRVAWWAEKKWEGLRMRKGDKVKKWKFVSRREDA